MTRRTPPAPNEFEVSVFGPGIGECIVLHLGNGAWAVVDSCMTGVGAPKLPVAAQYLQGLGVDLAASVKFIVATHWHEDHVEGVAALLDLCPNASLWCSAAMQGPEVNAFLASDDKSTLTTMGGAPDEFRRALEVIKARASGARAAHLAGPEWAQFNQVMYRQPAIHALSPSAATKTASLHAYFRKRGARRRALVKLSPNAVCVAMHVDFGAATVLLGSDLERGTQGLGWSGVLGHAQRPVSKGSLYKVAHHGSVGADDPDIWTMLLEPNVHAVLTPFRSCGLPRPIQTAAIRLKAPRAWITAGPTTKPLHGKPRMVAKRLELLGVVVSPRTTHSFDSMGQTRFRWDGSAWRVETFGAAMTLGDYHDLIRPRKPKEKKK